MNTRLRKMSPVQVLALTFLALILIGTLLLMLPWATTGEQVGLVDALFTATSAVCVTGLVVVDTGTRFTFFGQAVILLLIQFGGLGFMTVATMVACHHGSDGHKAQAAELNEQENYRLPKKRESSACIHHH